MRCVLVISLFVSLTLSCHGERRADRDPNGGDGGGQCRRTENGTNLLVRNPDSEGCCEAGFHSFNARCLGCPYGLRFTQCKRDCAVYCDESSDKPHLNCSSLANNFFDECEPGCMCPPDKYETVDGRCRDMEEICVRKTVRTPSAPTPTPATNRSCSEENSEYSDCHSSCIPTCRNFLSEGMESSLCAAVCVAGCRCREGFVLDESVGSCVLPANCTYLEFLPVTQVWGCYEGNCSDPFPRKCDHCDFGPKCKQGYVRDASNDCVWHEECQKICDDDETYDICHELEENCLSYPSVSLSPPGAVCFPGCQCDTGLVRNHLTGKCVNVTDCPAICQKDFEIPGCSECSKTCQSLNDISDSARVCDSCDRLDVCVCDVGYARDGSGDCVLVRDCDSPCNSAENKVLGCSSSLEECPRPGFNRNNRERRCYPEEDGCVCSPGYLYDNATNQCVSPDECASPCPQPNTVYANHSTPFLCHPGCYYDASYVSVNCWGVQGGEHPGCECAPGYTLNEDTAECVEECPNKCDASLKQTRMCESCGPTCDRPESCQVIDYCRYGCGCSEPYVLNSKTGECVLPSQCPQCTDCDPVNDENYKDGSCLPLLCNALGRITYRVNFVGTWNASSHPDFLFPSPHWSPLTGASHKPSYEIWENCFTNVTKGVSNVAEFGSPTRIIGEYAQHSEDVLDKIDDGILISGDGETTRYIDVNKNFHYVTLLSMMGDTKDYMVGVDRLDLCDSSRSGWKKSVRICLTLYSTGTKTEIAPGCTAHSRQFGNCSFGYIELTMVNNRDTQTPCADTEQYTQCNGYCQPRCEHAGPRVICPRVCKAGCECRDGYARDDRDDCVPLDTCASDPTPNTRCRFGDWVPAAITVYSNSAYVTEVRFVTHRPTGRYSSCPTRNNVSVKLCNESTVCQSISRIDQGCAVWIDPCLVQFECGTVAEAAKVGNKILDNKYSFFEPVRTHDDTTVSFTSLDFSQIESCLSSSNGDSCDWA